MGIRHIGVFESALGDNNFGICKRRKIRIRKLKLPTEMAHHNTYAVAMLVVAAENSTLVRLCFASESLNHSSYAPTETEFEVFLKICAQVLAV